MVFFYQEYLKSISVVLSRSSAKEVFAQGEKVMKCKWLASITLGIALTSAAADAATINVSTDNTTVLTTTTLTGFQTFGDDMVGMVVTANFSNSASETLIWTATGAGSGGVNGSLFSLDLSGDTFSTGTDWNLLNKNPAGVLTKLTINAGAGDTVFDIDPSSLGTVGSGFGRAFEERSAPLTGTISALYSNPVQLSGDTPVGDLYAMLMADFTDLTAGGLLFDSLFAFGADTDNLSISGDLRQVPLPAAMPLLLAALSALALFSRRRQETSA